MLYIVEKKNYNKGVRSETDTEVFARWLKLAVKVNSFAEFENELIKKEED